MFRGTFTAVVTPFRNGDVDFAAFEKLAEAQIAAGTTGVNGGGTTGESPKLTHDEKHEVIERAIKIANGRCKVIAGVGTNSTRDSIEATKFAEKAGADGALLVAPYYNKPSQEGLFRHFKAIAGATSLPVMLYNIPGRCAVDIAADTVARSAESLHRKLFPLFKDLFIEPNPVPAKTAMAWRGAMSAEVRLPLCEMSDANQTRLRKTVEEFEKAK